MLPCRYFLSRAHEFYRLNPLEATDQLGRKADPEIVWMSIATQVITIEFVLIFNNLRHRKTLPVIKTEIRS